MQQDMFIVPPAIARLQAKRATGPTLPSPLVQAKRANFASTLARATQARNEP